MSETKTLTEINSDQFNEIVPVGTPEVERMALIAKYCKEIKARGIKVMTGGPSFTYLPFDDKD